MPFSKRRKRVVYAALMLVAIAGGFFAYVDYSLSHMEFDFSGFDNFAKMAQATIGIATLTLPHCDSSADFLPNGDRKRQATLLYVSTIVDLYKTTFGKLPDKIDDLDKLPTFYHADRLNGREVKKNCAIHVQPDGSYVLVCGGPKPPRKEVAALASKGGPIQRFYLLGSTEALYVPAKACP
jgi:hypothetical protein